MAFMVTLFCTLKYRNPQKIDNLISISRKVVAKRLVALAGPLVVAVAARGAVVVVAGTTQLAGH